MYTGVYKTASPDTVFENVNLVYKKVPGQYVRTCHRPGNLVISNGYCRVTTTYIRPSCMNIKKKQQYEH